MRLSWKRPYLQVPHLHPWTTKRSQSSSEPWSKASQCRWLIDWREYIFVQHESLEPGGGSQQYHINLFHLIHLLYRWWSPTVPDASRDASAAAAAANSLHLPCASGLASSCTIIFKAKKPYLHIFAIVYTWAGAWGLTCTLCTGYNQKIHSWHILYHPDCSK